MKPQVSAPGTWVVSAKTNTASSYISYFGTSMAAPHVSGIAAQLHDASTTYRDYPCLTRAKLMASASPFGALRSWSSASESYYNRRGMGMADAYSAYFTNSNTGGWFGGTAVRTLTRSSAGFYFDVTVPADATRTFFVMTWDEKAPALNATRAVLYNCNLVLDVFPFDNDITKGEYYSSQSQSNYDWYGNVGSIAAVAAGLMLLTMTMLVRSRRQAVVSGVEQMLDSTGSVIDWADERGRVRVQGEVWQARATQPIGPGARVRVKAIEGLILVVEPESEGS